MHRWLNAFFALVMVLQFGWAAMGSHGMSDWTAHTTGADSGLFADGLDKINSQADGAMADAVESPCAEASCHGHHLCAAVACNIGPVLFHQKSDLGAITPVRLGDSHIPHGLDRPNWQRT